MIRICLCIFLLSACSTQTPPAPPLAPPEAGQQEPVRDAGPAPSDTGTGPSYLPYDGGPTHRADAPSFDRASYDAGFVLVELPEEAAEDDPCGHTCRGRPCARKCRLECRQQLPRIPVPDRERFMDCVAAESCTVLGCVGADAPVDPACEALCGNPYLADCGLAELWEAGMACPEVCTAQLASMLPAARQAFLQCGIQRCVASGQSCSGNGQCPEAERCGAGRCIPDRLCPAIDFIGPSPSQECLQVAQYRERCRGPRTESLYKLAWECEGWRPNRDNLDWAGGNVYISCLANREECDGMNAYWQCLGTASAAMGRRRVAQEACGHVAGCDGGRGWTCNWVMAGVGRFMGRYVERRLARCTAAAGMDCEALVDCVDNLWTTNEPGDDCGMACARCGQINDACINLCMYHRNSMTFPQAEAYRHCLRHNPNCENNIAERCVREVLPEEMVICDELMDAIGQCAEWEAYTANNPWPGWCAIGGLRTGLLDGPQLQECVDRTNCAVNPWEACAR